jgi:hypothetical protein
VQLVVFHRYTQAVDQDQVEKQSSTAAALAWVHEMQLAVELRAAPSLQEVISTRWREACARSALPDLQGSGKRLEHVLLWSFAAEDEISAAAPAVNGLSGQR